MRSVAPQVPIGEILDLLGNAFESQIAFVDSDWRIRYANDAFLTWHSRPTVMLQGKNLDDVISRAAMEWLTPHLEASLDGHGQEFEGTMRHPTAGLRSFIGRVEPDALPDGTVNGFLVILRDVTDGKSREQLADIQKAEREAYQHRLRESELRFRTMVDESPLSIQIFDADGRCIHYNAAWQRLWMAEPSALAEYNLFLDPELVKQGLPQLFKRALAGEEVEMAAFHYDARKSRVGSRARWVSALLYPVSTGEGRQEVALILQDFTEEREAQMELHETKERLQLIVNTSLDAVITADSEDRITAWDGQAANIFGWTRDEVMGQRLYDTIVNGGSRGARERTMAHFLKERGRPLPNKRVQVDAQHKNGHRFPAEIAISMAKQNGQLFYILTARDISERVKTREELHSLNSELEARVVERTTALRQTNAELEEAYRKLETFSYSVAHSLRNPLRRIGAIASILQTDAPISESDRENMESLKHFVKNMARLIEDHLNFARYAHNELHLSEVDFSKLVWSVVREIEAQYPKTKFAVRTLPNINLLADPLLLRVALENLLDNAAKFSRQEKEPKVEVGAVLRDKEGNPLETPVFYVRDNGVGFDAEFAHKVFMPFERLHREDDFGGNGVGLFNTKEIVGRHGGKIWAESEVGKGATFKFTLAPGS